MHKWIGQRLLGDRCIAPRHLAAYPAGVLVFKGTHARTHSPRSDTLCVCAVGAKEHHSAALPQQQRVQRTAACTALSGPGPGGRVCATRRLRPSPRKAAFLCSARALCPTRGACPGPGTHSDSDCLRQQRVVPLHCRPVDTSPLTTPADASWPHRARAVKDPQIRNLAALNHSTRTTVRFAYRAAIHASNTDHCCPRRICSNGPTPRGLFHRHLPGSLLVCLPARGHPGTRLLDAPRKTCQL